MENEGLIDPLTVGHWEGMTFRFDQPVFMTDEEGRQHTMTAIELEGMTMEEGITPDDVISALVNSKAREQ